MKDLAFAVTSILIHAIGFNVLAYFVVLIWVCYKVAEA